MSTTNKKPIKKSTATRSKTERKNTVRKKAAKKAVKKAVKKTNTKTAIEKVAVKKTGATKTAKKLPTNKKAEKDDVKLPKNMSVRSIEKTTVLKREFEEYVRLSMYRIAYVSAICFMFVGAALLFSQAVIPVNSQMLLGQASGTTDPNLQPTSTSTTTIPDPVFNLTSTLQSQYLQPDRITFSVTHVDDVKGHLVQTGVTGSIPLTVNNLLNDKYRVTIPVDQLVPGYYKLNILVKPSNDTVFRLEYQTPEFHVGPYPTNTSPSADPTTTTNDSTNTSSTGVDTTSTVSTTTATTTQAPSPTTDTDTIDDRPFALVLPGDAIISGTEIIWASVPAGLSSEVILYARPLNSLDPIPVTKAIKRERWVFVIDSANRLPNGKYKFYAEAIFEGTERKTKPVTFTVINESSEAETPVETGSTDSDPVDVTPQDRPFVVIRDDSLDPVEDFVPTIIIEDDIREETEQLLKDNSAEMEELLQRYASAVQTGDEMLINAAREELTEKRKEIVFETMKDKRLQDISDNIDEELSDRIDDLQERVDTFEQIRREKSEGATAVDTDEDGISDYDERHLYGTDPEDADSDNDGFLDGVEIIKGFNPNSDEPEAIIEFESPKESVGLVRDDVLVVDEVIRIEEVDTEESKVPVKAKIRGRGLPNSFVTLYIYSTPAVVTVRTDADGMFEYIFDKELDDGRHDVYVAVTDNAGDIIAQSSPFSFIKEAEAFTEAEAAEEELIQVDPIIEPAKNSYGMVVGIGILAFGLILLMLGISLRSKKDDSEDGSDDDSEAGPPEQKTGSETPEKPNSRFEHIDAT